eukprot:s1441_g2.t1
MCGCSYGFEVWRPKPSVAQALFQEQHAIDCRLWAITRAALFGQSSFVLTVEARCMPFLSLQTFWYGAARLECVAALQAMLRLQTTAVQGEIFLPSVTAVASAANVGHLNAGRQCCCHKTLSCASGASFRTDAGCLASEHQKEARSFNDGLFGGTESPSAFPFSAAEVSLWTSVPPQPNWAPSDIKESILELLALHRIGCTGGLWASAAALPT